MLSGAFISAWSIPLFDQADREYPIFARKPSLRVPDLSDYRVEIRWEQDSLYSVAMPWKLASLTNGVTGVIVDGISKPQAFHIGKVIIERWYRSFVVGVGGSARVEELLEDAGRRAWQKVLVDEFGPIDGLEFTPTVTSGASVLPPWINPVPIVQPVQPIVLTSAVTSRSFLKWPWPLPSVTKRICDINIS